MLVQVERLRTSLIGVAIFAAASCTNSTPSPPSMGSAGPVTINGTERLGWDQLAADRNELSTIGYAVYLDGARSVVTGEICADTASAAGFECKAPLPQMRAGAHSIELAAFYKDNPSNESARAGPLQVTLNAISAIAPDAPRVSTARSTPRSTATPATASFRSSQEWPSSAVRVADGVNRPSDLVFTPDGRLWIAESNGGIRVVRDGVLLRAPAVEVPRINGSGAVLALAVDPQFERTHFMFAIYTSRSRTGALTFALARFRETADTLGDRIVLLDDVPASSDPHASLRFGADGKLYAAFDDAQNERAVEDLASYNGKILRLNPDGTTPDDAPRKSPVFSSGLTSPRGLAWSQTSGYLWDADVSRVGRMPQTIAPAALAIVHDDLLIASAAGIAAAKIDRRNPGQVTTTRKVLDNVAVRALATAPDGSVYFAAADAIGRIVP
jgi:glucose/arabinose dehydrogenase